MNRIKINLLIVALFALPKLANADTFPNFPMSFYGSATLNGQALPVGSKILAFANGVLQGESVLTEPGIYGYTDPTKNKLVVGDYSGNLAFFYKSGITEPDAGCKIQEYVGGFKSGNALEYDLAFQSAGCGISFGGGGGQSGGGSVAASLNQSPADDFKAIATSTRIGEVKGVKLIETPIAKNAAKYDSLKNDVLRYERKFVKKDAKFAEKNEGRILIQVESSGRAWYVSTIDHKKYYLGKPDDAFLIMRKLGLGVKHEVVKNTKSYPDRLLGKIIIDTGDKGKAYYINSKDKKAYYLGKPGDAFKIIRKFGIGISNANIRKIALED